MSPWTLLILYILGATITLFAIRIWEKVTGEKSDDIGGIVVFWPICLTLGIVVGIPVLIGFGINAGVNKLVSYIDIRRNDNV